ncbi:uncharacterized protein LOC113746334 [Larimichthys crocea]|uniref:uncharacterized protein LOC113746334 n=1 Tax=Larimichthys crocea TaxID=215358 RepID=UPI000F5E28B7|nr:uncharacterized protein LOC113746334 [Larimichthys crocea]
MSPTDRLRLLVLCLWLLHVDVNCENTQKGYVLRAQDGLVPTGVRNDEGNYKRWREPRIFRIRTAGYKKSNVNRGQSAREDHTTDSESSHVQSHSPVIPETQNFPKGQVNRLKSGFNSASPAQGRSIVVNNRSGNKKIHQANSDSTRVFQVPLYRSRTKMMGGFSPVQVDRATESLKIDINPSRANTYSSQPQESRPATRPEVSRYRPAYVFPRSFNHDRANAKLINQKTDSVVSSPARNLDKLMSHPTWSPRVYSGDVTPGARGYAHVRHVKPGFDKTRPQLSSAASGKFLETGHGDPASSERQINVNHNSRGSQTSSGHPSPNKAQIPIQGKFKPFQRLPTNDTHTHSSEGEPAPTQTSAGANLTASLNSSVIPSVSEESSNKSASPMQTEGQDAELLLQASNQEDQSEHLAEVGTSLEQNKTVTVAPPKLRLAENVWKGDKVVTSPPETDQSEV